MISIRERKDEDVHIRVLINYGGALTNELRIEPGDYSADDPRLFGLADHLLEAGHAIALDDDDAVEELVAPQVEWETISHEEWAALEGRLAPPAAVDYEAFTVEQLRALCVERGIDLDALSGSGRDGRLLKADLIAVLEGDDLDAAEDI